MRKAFVLPKILFFVLLSQLILTGCSKENDTVISEQPVEIQDIGTQVEESAAEEIPQATEMISMFPVPKREK